MDSTSVCKVQVIMKTPIAGFIKFKTPGSIRRHRLLGIKFRIISVGRMRVRRRPKRLSGISKKFYNIILVNSKLGGYKTLVGFSYGINFALRVGCLSMFYKIKMVKNKTAG